MSEEEHTLKSLLLLAKLQRKFMQKEKAIETLLRVCRRDPFVIEALEQLAELGVHPDTLTDICGQTDLQWLPKWLQAKFEENRCHYQDAIVALQELESRNSLSVYLFLGRCQAQLLRYESAVWSFRKAQEMDPLNTQELDFLAYVYFCGGKKGPLSSLAHTMLSADPDSDASWVTVALFHFISNKAALAENAIEKVVLPWYPLQLFHSVIVVVVVVVGSGGGVLAFLGGEGGDGDSGGAVGGGVVE